MDDQQNGFRYKHKRIDQMAELTEKIRSSKGKVGVPVVLIDFIPV